jgi:hypothetical protein
MARTNHQQPVLSSTQIAQRSATRRGLGGVAQTACGVRSSTQPSVREPNETRAHQQRGRSTHGRLAPAAAHQHPHPQPPVRRSGACVLEPVQRARDGSTSCVRGGHADAGLHNTPSNPVSTDRSHVPIAFQPWNTSGSHEREGSPWHHVTQQDSSDAEGCAATASPRHCTVNPQGSIQASSAAPCMDLYTCSSVSPLSSRPIRTHGERGKRT